MSLDSGTVPVLSWGQSEHALEHRLKVTWVRILGLAVLGAILPYATVGPW